MASRFKYSKRWGYIRISAHVLIQIEDEGCTETGEKWKEIASLMRHVFVAEARPCYPTDDIIYLCISPMFDELEEGEEVPEYKALLSRDLNNPIEYGKFVRFERLNIKVQRRPTGW